MDVAYKKSVVKSIAVFMIGNIYLCWRRIIIRDVRFYLEDPTLNPLTPWSRPPIKNIYCIYGVDMKTEVPFFGERLFLFITKDRV